MKRSVYFIFSLLFAILAISACRHKDLCFDHAHTADVDVIFDWKYAPSARPGSMALYLFPKGGGEYLRYDFTDRNGGTVRLPAGEYDAVCINSDTKDISYVNRAVRPAFEVSTRTTSLLSSLSPLGVSSKGAPRANHEERIALSPDMLWTDMAEGITIVLTAGTRQTIVLYPKVSVSNITVEIRNAQNLKYVNGVSFSLSGMSGGLLPGLGSNSVTKEIVTIPFESATSVENSTITGGTRTFGHCPSGVNKHILTVYAVLANNTKWYYTYDVTEQIHNAPDQRNIHIILDGLPLPKPITNGSGFKPEVNEWQVVEIDISL